MIRDVVLLHGLWMPGLVMRPLASRLEARGYRAHVFDYASRLRPLEVHADRLARFAREAADGAPVHFVGHSLGGVLIYDLLQKYPSMPCGKVVLLGAPVRGCFAGRRLGSAGIGRWMLGGCAERWTERDASWRRTEHLGVIAGTRVFGLGRALGALPGENDGVVRVEETVIEGVSERVLVREPHSMLPLSASVAALVERFLRSGRFA